MSIQPTAFYRWATNIVNDPTTLQDNRTPITLALQDNGWVPFGVKPERQKMNESLHQLGLWTEYQFTFAQQYFDKNKINMVAGSFKSSGSSIVIVKGANMRFICDDFVTASNKTVVTQIPNFTKNNEIAWSSGGTGLRGYAGIVNDVFIYLFVISQPNGVSELISDTSPSGVNIKANLAVIASPFTFIRQIATLSYIDTGGGNRFRPFIYSDNDMILYPEEFSGQGFVFTSSSATFQTKVITDTGGNLLPNELCIAKLIFQDNNDVATPAAKSFTNITEADEPNSFGLSPGNTIAMMFEQVDSSFRMHSGSSPSQAGIRVQVLGYQNPSIEN